MISSPKLYLVAIAQFGLDHPPSIDKRPVARRSRLKCLVAAKPECCPAVRALSELELAVHARDPIPWQHYAARAISANRDPPTYGYRSMLALPFQHADHLQGGGRGKFARR
eukprot:767958-Hanusia_phi.AAC.9